jgi:hypothetical protein
MIICLGFFIEILINIITFFLLIPLLLNLINTEDLALQRLLKLRKPIKGSFILLIEQYIKENKVIYQFKNVL